MTLYLIYGFGMVTCTVSPLSRFTAHLLPYFLFTVRLRIFHVCRNKNFCNRYLSFYWKKRFYIWYMAFAWWIVPCLPFPGLPHIYFLFTARFRIFHVCRNENFVTDISDSTGRNDFIFDIWLLHGELYCVSPFHVYCTSTSCLPRDLEFFMFAVMKTFATDISASTGRNDFIFDIWLLHGDLYRVSPFQVTVITNFFSLWLHKSLLCTFQPVYNDLCRARCFRLVCDPFSGNECWDIYKFDTNERVGVFLARRSMQHLVVSTVYIDDLWLTKLIIRFTNISVRQVTFIEQNIWWCTSNFVQ